MMVNIKEIIINAATKQKTVIYYTDEELAEIEKGKLLNPPIEPKEPIDQEKIAMGEAIINLTMQLEELKLKIEGGK